MALRFVWHGWKIVKTWQFFSTFFGWLSDPFKGYISDLQLGDKKVTLNHLKNVSCKDGEFSHGKSTKITKITYAHGNSQNVRLWFSKEGFHSWQISSSWQPNPKKRIAEDLCLLASGDTKTSRTSAYGSLFITTVGICLFISRHISPTPRKKPEISQNLSTDWCVYYAIYIEIKQLCKVRLQDTKKKCNSLLPLWKSVKFLGKPHSRYNWLRGFGRFGRQPHLSCTNMQSNMQFGGIGWGAQKKGTMYVPKKTYDLKIYTPQKLAWEAENHILF